MNLKGSLSLLVLHALSQEAKHGYRIVKEIRQQSEGVLDFKEGSLYPTLRNMAEQGLIEAHEIEKNGRVRRYYRLTDAGRAQLSAEREAWQRFSQAVNQILKGTPS